MHAAEMFAADGEEGELFPRKRHEEDANFDITAMIDLVFMMNIYFMVTALVTAMLEINLAPALHCTPAEKDGAVVIMVMAPLGDGASQVFLGENAGSPLEPADQEREITAAIEVMLAAGHAEVIIKAEQDVAHKDISELMRIANEAGDIQLFLGVHEMN